MPILLEACLDSVDGAIAAERAGAERIELCERLDVGGTTPSPKLLRAVTASVKVPVFPIIRVRGGDFIHGAAEVEQMKRDVETAAANGAAGIVLGILRDDRTVNARATREVMAVAPHLPATFHLAFDAARDPFEALDTVASIGMARVLTRGGASTALAGVDELRRLVAHASGGGAVRILAGGSIREDSAEEVVRRSGVTEIHTKGTAIARILAAARRGGAVRLA